MKKRKFRVCETLYFDFWERMWSTEKPEGKYLEDYSIWRIGTKLEEDESIGEEVIYLCDKKGRWIEFRNEMELKECIDEGIIEEKQG